MTDKTTPQWAVQLIELLSQQRSLYQQLEGLSQEQSRLVQAGDTDPLLSLLSQRQRLIDQLTQIAPKLEPYKKDWQETWSGLTESDQQRVGTLVRDVQGLLDRIIQQDERDHQSLNEQRVQTGASLSKMSRGSAVHRAYTQSSTPDSLNRYADHQG